MASKKSDYIGVTEFLSVYKSLEQALSSQNMTVLDYESVLPSDEADKLKTCRIMRNYVAHHSDGDSFLCFSGEQFSFVDRLISRIKSSERTVKDITIHLTPIVNGVSTYTEVLRRFSVTGRMWLPVVGKDKNFVGILSCKRFLTMLHGLMSDNKSPDVFFLIVNETVLAKDVKAFGIKTVSSNAVLSTFAVDDELVVVKKSGIYVGLADWSKY